MNDCHFHASLLATVQQIVNNVSLEVTQIDKQVKTYYPSARPSAEIIMSNPFAINANQPVFLSVNAALLKLGRIHGQHNPCIPNLVTTLQDIGWKLHMQNWSVTTTYSMLRQIIGMSQRLQVPQTKPSGTGITVQPHNLYTTSSVSNKTAVASTPKEQTNTQIATYACTCCPDCVEAIHLTIRSFNIRLENLKSTCLLIMNMLKTAVNQNQALIRHLTEQCNNQIDMYNRVCNLGNIGRNRISVSSMPPPAISHTANVSATSETTPLVHPNITNVQPHTNNINLDKTTVSCPQSAQIDTSNTSVNRPVAQPKQLTMQSQQTSPKDGNCRPNTVSILSPKPAVRYDQPALVQRSSDNVLPLVASQLQPSLDSTDKIQPPVLTSQNDVTTIQAPDTLGYQDHPVFIPQLSNSQSSEISKKTVNYHLKPLVDQLEDTMLQTKYQNVSQSHAYSILQDANATSSATSNLIPQTEAQHSKTARKRLFPADSSVTSDQTRFAKSPRKSLPQLTPLYPDFPSTLVATVLGVPSSMVSIYWSGSNNRHINLAKVRPYPLQGVLSLQRLHSIVLYFKDVPRYDPFSGQIPADVSEASVCTYKPTTFARDIIWRLFTLEQLHQLWNRENDFSAFMSALSTATINKFAISKFIWDNHCLGFIRRSINYLFTKKLCSPVFQRYLRGFDIEH